MNRVPAETSMVSQSHGESPTRRELLCAGTAGALGLALEKGLRVEASEAALGMAHVARKGPAARSVILVFLEGGLSQVDSFDPKPEAVSEVRGEFGAIRTSVDGIRISELWPEVARVAHHMTFIRSMSHGEAAHERGMRQMLDGLMAVAGAEVNDGSLMVRGLTLAGGASHGCSVVRTVPASLSAGREREATREAYGRNAFGQRLLMARRMVEAGRPFVAVRHGGWDMHADVHAGMRARVPAVDRALAALIRDLAGRGLLESTLVMISTEFGRTPQINRDGGRDHWSRVFSVALAGGGIRGGQVIGASSADGMEPRDTPVCPGDVVASVSRRLGIPTERGTIIGLA